MHLLLTRTHSQSPSDPGHGGPAAAPDLRPDRATPAGGSAALWTRPAGGAEEPGGKGAVDNTIRVCVSSFSLCVCVCVSGGGSLVVLWFNDVQSG